MCDAGNTPEAGAITSATVAQEPLFVVIGGDLAYDNGMPSCYRCWDQYLTGWESRMVTPQGFTVPLLTVVGNHDVGTNSGDGAYASMVPFTREDDVDGRIPLYFHMFPHGKVRREGGRGEAREREQQRERPLRGDVAYWR